MSLFVGEVYTSWLFTGITFTARLPLAIILRIVCLLIFRVPYFSISYILQWKIMQDRWFFKSLNNLNSTIISRKDIFSLIILKVFLHFSSVQFLWATHGILSPRLKIWHIINLDFFRIFYFLINLRVGLFFFLFWILDKPFNLEFYVLVLIIWNFFQFSCPL